jgi:hypothetical protein
MTKEPLSGELYEIVVKEPIDPYWSEWLGDFEITRTENKETRLIGHVKDKTALYGLLNQLRDLNLSILFLRRIPQDV